MKIKAILFFLAIILLGTVLRFYGINNPNRGFYLDEAAIGYNAYSILKTGKDEFGKSYPLLFRSFTDFKAPLYIYLTTVPIKMFDLNAFSTRFISALSGVLSLVVVFLLSKILLDDKKDYQQNYSLSLLVMLILTISPWHVFYSRGAWEANLSFFLLLLGSYFSITGFLKNNKIILFLGSILFVLSAYAYHGQRIVAPLIFISYLIIFRHWLLKEKKFAIFLLLVLTTISLPIFRVSFTPGGQSRMNSLNIFSEKSILPWTVKSDVHNTSFLNNRLLISSRKWFALYTAYYSPKNLFSPDPAEKQRWLVNLSAFYPWQFIFFIFGLIFYFSKKSYMTLRRFTLPWLFFSPVAASFTGDPFSSVRAIPLVFPISIVIGIGIYESMIFLQDKFSPLIKSYLTILISLSFTLIIIASLINLLTQILYITPHQHGKYWETGYYQLVNELLKFPKGKIIMDNARGEGYIHLLFFSKFDPRQYQQEAGFMELNNYYDSYQRIENKKFGRFEYRQINWETDSQKGNLIVGDELFASKEKILADPNLSLVKEIEFPDKSIAFRIMEVK